MKELDLLPGIPEDLVRAAFARAGGDELRSGKFANPQSSAALAANGFGWFLERPALLPPFPGLEDLDWPARTVAIERQMRFPWRGGRHPWLDAAVETDKHLIGIESKRYEPFRDRKAAKLSDAYDRDVWGEGMQGWCAMRDALRRNPRRYRHLDAAQMVKHAFGLVTEGRRIGKEPVLLFLYAEPDDAPGAPDVLAVHRAELADLSPHVRGDRVRFAACSWGNWLSRFGGAAEGHAARVIDRFAP